MFSSRLSVVLFLFGSFLLLFTPQFLSADITGSVHDFSNQAWSGGEICRVCHTPHNADTTVLDAPLWNHTVSSATYDLYTSPTLYGQTEQPRGPSKLCLSCHDGTVAIDSFGGAAGNSHISGQALIGTDLRDDHPISIPMHHGFDYSAGPPDCLNCHMPNGGFGVPVMPFPDGYVECSTCHDVHNNYVYEKLLRLPLYRSQLCKMCHWK